MTVHYKNSGGAKPMDYIKTQYKPFKGTIVSKHFHLTPHVDTSGKVYNVLIESCSKVGEGVFSNMDNVWDGKELMLQTIFNIYQFHKLYLPKTYLVNKTNLSELERDINLFKNLELEGSKLLENDSVVNRLEIFDLFDRSLTLKIDRRSSFKKTIISSSAKNLKSYLHKNVVKSEYVLDYIKDHNEMEFLT